MPIPYLQKSPEGQLVPDLASGQSLQSWEQNFVRLTGCGSPEYAELLLQQLLRANGLNPDSDITQINALIAALVAMQPSSPVEALLIAQMLACGSQSLTLMGKARSAAFPELSQKWTGLAVRMANLYTKQVEALEKSRRKGTQHVHVEYLHMESNSQAVIGSVDSSKPE